MGTQNRQALPAKKDKLDSQEFRKLLLQANAQNPQTGMKVDRNGLTAVFKGERFFLFKHSNYGKTKVRHVYRAGDILSREKVSVDWLQRCGTMPDKLKGHLMAYEKNDPSLLVTLLTTFLEIPDPELEIGKRIVEIHPRNVKYVFVVWFDGKTAVEFADETFSEYPVTVNICLNGLVTAKALKGAEAFAKIEYYILSSLVSPVSGAAKGVAKGVARKATYVTYKSIASKSIRATVSRTIRNLSTGFSGAIAKSSFKAGGSFYKDFIQQLEALQIQKGRTNPPSDAEIRVIAEKAGLKALKDFIFILIKETLMRNALKKNKVEFTPEKNATYGRKFDLLMEKTLCDQVEVHIPAGLATLLLDPALKAYTTALDREGKFRSDVFQQKFVPNLKDALEKFFLQRLTAISDAALPSLTTQAVSML